MTATIFSRCLVCRAPFPKGKVLEHIPFGDRVAYDPDRGRLWIVCRSCRRWTLAPIEERWEALEALEKIVSRGPGGARKTRLLSKTDHIALFAHGPLEIVRIGGAELPEEAWWRYGRQEGFQSFIEQRIPELARRARHGEVAWKGSVECKGCGFEFRKVLYAKRKSLIVRPGEDTEGPGPSPVLIRRCPRCLDTVKGGLHLTGTAADLTLSRVMAYEHYVGAPKERIRSAVKAIQDAGGAPAMVHLLTRHGKTLGDLPPVGCLALEITAIEARERALMRLELAELKFVWREAEELAALVDGELTHVPFLYRLLGRGRGER